MAPDGLERLGYYNGQRLEAFDYRLEQSYHIDARRMLNRGLFTPGVVSGFIVEKIAGQTRKVMVRRGVALDPVGREIILLEDTPVDVPNQKPTTGPGHLLIVRYSEAAVEGGDPWCSGPSGAPRPARVSEMAVLEWSEYGPDHGRCQSGAEGQDCGILLAFVTLTPSCEVEAVSTGVREFARPTHLSQVTPFSFEGEKDIDSQNPKRLRFGINGIPVSLRLYLWGARFSTLYYTEIGQHSHTFDKPTEPAAKYDAHTHSLSLHTHPIPPADPHNHRIRQAYGDVGSGADIQTEGSSGARYVFSDKNDPLAQFIERVTVTFSQPSDEPAPNVSGGVIPDPAELHRHGLPDTVPFGAPDAPAHGPHVPAYGWLDDLRISFVVGGADTDITDSILRRLSGGPPPAPDPTNWGRLGTGNPNDLLNSEGTGEIDLLAVANEKNIDLSVPGTYELKFSVPKGGGNVAYNLFVA